MWHFLRMPRYFFNMYGVRAFTDDVGDELANDDAAWYEATLVAAQTFRDIDGKFRPDQEWRLEVTNDHQTPLFSIRIISKRMTRL
jgi:hypothetical protein